MAVAGPAVSVVLAGIFGLAALVGSVLAWPLLLVVMLGQLAAVNAVLVGFNLLPAFPLDGGRVLRAILWAATGNLRRATAITARMGSFLGSALMALGLLGLLFDQLLTIGLRPDLAIFIDGLNEFTLIDEPPVFASYLTSEVREDLEQPLRRVVRELPIVRLLSPKAGENRFADYVRSSQPAAAARPRPIAEQLVARYRANQRMA